MSRQLRVLIACEFSGVVRQAFRALGHDAWSCDLLPAEDGSKFHMRVDGYGGFSNPLDSPTLNLFHVLKDEMGEGWDLVIAHPPCTYLCNSGVRWLAPGGQLDYARHREMQAGCDFFAALYHAPVEHLAIENPVMHKYARNYLANTRSVPWHSQTFQPWQHGEPEVKRTCLWLRGLPLLLPSNVVEGRTARVHRASPGVDRWKERSRTLPGIAKAMALQWSEYLLKP